MSGPQWLSGLVAAASRWGIRERLSSLLDERRLDEWSF